MRIKQVRVSRAIAGFAEPFRKKYGLRPYHDKTAPALFFGCYTYNGVDIPAVEQHKGIAVVIFAGTDAMRLPHELYKVRYRNIINRKDTHFVAISKHISEDMLRAGIPHIFLPICPTSFEKLKPVPLGPCIYTYGSHRYPERYGAPMVAEVHKKIPDLEIITCYPRPPGHYPRAAMPRLYTKCFMGLRLLKHDGLANTVVELGLMGRFCMWNGWLPNAVSYRSVDDIVCTIRKQRELVGTTNEKLAGKVRRSLKLPKDWLLTEFYRRLQTRGRSPDGSVTIR